MIEKPLPGEPRRPKTRDYWIYNPDNKHPRHEDLKEVPIGRLVSQGPKFSKPSEGFLKVTDKQSRHEAANIKSMIFIFL